MRPIANFTLHAALATVLIAFAAASAAAGGDALKLLATTGPIKAGDGQHIDVLSYSFGVSDTRAKGKVEHEWKVEEGESAPPPPGGVRVASGDVDSDSSNVGGSEKQTVGANRTRSAQATGKRQHKPLTITKEWGAATPRLAEPLAKGSVWVRVATPWAGCQVGARYPSLELAGSGKRYVLQDVTVASCGGTAASDDRPTEEVAFYYNKIAFNYANVRGWDPKKKEAVTGQAEPR